MFFKNTKVVKLNKNVLLKNIPKKVIHKRIMYIFDMGFDFINSKKNFLTFKLFNI